MLRSEQSYREILKSSSVMGIASLVKIVIVLLRIKLVAVLLGPAGVGLVGLLQNFISAGSVVASFGIGEAGKRQVAEAVSMGDPTYIASTRHALFLAALVLSLLSGLSIWLGRHVLANLFFGDPELSVTVGWLGAGVALTVASSSQLAFLTGNRRIGDIAKISVLSSLLATVIGGLFIWYFEERGIVALVLATPIASCVMGHIFVAKMSDTAGVTVDKKILTKQWSELSKLGFALVLAGLAAPVGQLMVRSQLQRDLGPDALGLFEASWIISMTYLGFMLTAMGQDFYPRLTSVIGNADDANRIINEQSQIGIILAGPVIIGLMSLSPWVMTILYTAEFSEATKVLRWYLIADVFKIVSWPLGYILLAAGDGRMFVVTQSMWIFVFPLVTGLLIPYMGIEATGIGYLALYIVTLPLLYLLANRRTGFQWTNTVLKDLLILFVVVLMIAIVGSQSESVAAVIGSFLAMAFVLRAVSRLRTMVGVQKPSRLVVKSSQ